MSIRFKERVLNNYSRYHKTSQVHLRRIISSTAIIDAARNPRVISLHFKKEFLLAFLSQPPGVIKRKLCVSMGSIARDFQIKTGDERQSQFKGEKHQMNIKACFF